MSLLRLVRNFRTSVGRQGLDQWAVALRSLPAEAPEAVEVDLDLESTPAEEEVIVGDWRKHPDLHGWMERLYRQKGGQQKEFNTPASVRLRSDDLERLQADLLARRLPPTTGFFFGESTGEELEEDLEFVKRAQEQLQQGRPVYYTSWW